MRYNFATIICGCSSNYIQSSLPAVKFGCGISLWILKVKPESESCGKRSCSAVCGDVPRISRNLHLSKWCTRVPISRNNCVHFFSCCSVTVLFNCFCHLSPQNVYALPATSPSGCKRRTYHCSCHIINYKRPNSSQRFRTINNKIINDEITCVRSPKKSHHRQLLDFLSRFHGKLQSG